MTYPQTPVRPAQVERYTRAADAIRDLVTALPDGIQILSIGTGKHLGADIEAHIHGLSSALAAVDALGGIWQHTLHQSSTDTVHHYWTKTHNGAVVRLTAIWDGTDLAAEDIPPMVAGAVTA